MAQQKGILPLRGSIGNITFYKSKEGYLAKEKSGIDAKRIASDPAFKEPVKTARNLAELEKPANFCGMQ